MTPPRASLATLLASSSLVLAACGVLPLGGQDPAPVSSRAEADASTNARPRPSAAAVEALAAPNPKANDVVLFALGLIETGYRFGGKNPEAGLDCSGMVSYVFDQSVNLKLKGSAADIARRGRIVDIAYIQQRSMGTDVKLLAKTLPAVVRGRGAY